MITDFLNHEFFMKQAVMEAGKAAEQGEVPVGAIVVARNVIIARAHNLTETLYDATAHAEIQAITAASNALGSKYLNDCIMYVSLEPCMMCAGAIFWAQLGILVFGASDMKRGFRLNKIPVLHPQTQVVSGILASESEYLLKSFFQPKR
jgi:tRNA(adenine34) deaminase